MKIISVVGARPNFMKMAPIHKAIQKRSPLTKDSFIKHIVCHTGQHYDTNMSKIFFEDLELPRPDFYLGIGSGTHTEQTAKVMMAFEKVLLEEKPNLVIVYGDVNSTLACSLVTNKMGILLAHIEAGLRSFDRSMPEEINRIITDHLTDYLFVTEKSGLENLQNEGISAKKTVFAGNTMIDSLEYYIDKSNRSNILVSLDVLKNNYILVTLHRPSNVDNLNNLANIIKMLNEVNSRCKIIFPMHPRTRTIVEKLNVDILFKVIPPVGYIDFIALMKNALVVLTDSGGIQEETTYLGVQCLTLRENTERPITVEVGTNQIVGTDLIKVKKAILDILSGKLKKGQIPQLWDSHASDRIISYLQNVMN
jgi:UDP-N-acetylglucosamine 2-epimerase (non-hydrolysing)